MQQQKPRSKAVFLGVVLGAASCLIKIHLRPAFLKPTSANKLIYQTYTKHSTKTRRNRRLIRRLLCSSPVSIFQLCHDDAITSTPDTGQGRPVAFATRKINSFETNLRYVKLTWQNRRRWRQTRRPAGPQRAADGDPTSPPWWLFMTDQLKDECAERGALRTPPLRSAGEEGGARGQGQRAKVGGRSCDAPQNHGSVGQMKEIQGTPSGVGWVLPSPAPEPAFRCQIHQSTFSKRPSKWTEQPTQGVGFF